MNRLGIYKSIKSHSALTIAHRRKTSMIIIRSGKSELFLFSTNANYVRTPVHKVANWLVIWERMANKEKYERFGRKSWAKPIMFQETYHCYICHMPFSVHSTLEKHMRKCVVNSSQNGAPNGLPIKIENIGSGSDILNWIAIINRIQIWRSSKDHVQLRRLSQMQPPFWLCRIQSSPQPSRPSAQSLRATRSYSTGCR